MEWDILGWDFKLLVEQRQWDKLFSFILNYVLTKPAAIFAVSIFFVCCGMVFFGMGSEGKKRKVFKRLALCSYIFVLLLLSVLNRDSGTREVRIFFDAWIAGANAFHESNVIIALIDFFYFVPYGMLLRWQRRWHAHWLMSLGIVSLSGFLIEFFQFVFARGVSSLEDFAAYTLGGMAGVALGHLIVKSRYR